MSIIPKFLRKLKPLKIVGNVVKAVVPGGGAIVSTVEEGINAVKGSKASGPQVAQAAVTGAVAGVKAQLSANETGTFLQTNGATLAIVAGGVLILFLATRRR